LRDLIAELQAEIKEKDDNCKRALEAIDKLVTMYQDSLDHNHNLKAKVVELSIENLVGGRAVGVLNNAMTSWQRLNEK